MLFALRLYHDAMESFDHDLMVVLSTRRFANEVRNYEIEHDHVAPLHKSNDRDCPLACREDARDPHLDLLFLRAHDSSLPLP